MLSYQQQNDRKWNELKEWITETLGLTRQYGDLEIGMSIVLKRMYDIESRESKREFFSFDGED